MAEPQTAQSTDADQKTDSADGAGGDAALKAIAHLQRVAETLSSDAAKLNAEAPAEKPAGKKTEHAKSTERIRLPALAAQRAGAGAKPRAAAGAADWWTNVRAQFANVEWSHAAAAVFLTFAVAGGAYFGLMDYLDRKDAQRVAAEETLRHPPETAVERDLRGKIAELTLDLQSLRAQVGKAASDARGAQTHAANAAASAGTANQAAARAEKAGKDLSTKVDGQVARIERLERIAADPIVTSSIAREQKGQPTSAAGAPAPSPARQGLRTPDPTMKANTFVLRSVRNGVAMVQTRGGMMEVGPGDRIPGVGRVRSIERLDGRWVLVMQDGYIDQDD